MRETFLSRTFAFLAVALLVAPAAFMAYTPPAKAITVENIFSDTSWTSIQTAVESAYSAVKDAITAIASVTSAAKETALVIERYVLQPLAYITTGNLLKKITSSILGFVGGKNALGKPLYIQDMRGYIQNVGDVEAYSFLAQFQSQSNSPFASAITSSLRANYLQGTSLAGFFAANKSTLSNYSSDPNSFIAGNWGKGGWLAFLGLATVDQNNPYLDYYLVADQFSRQRQTAQTSKTVQAIYNQGFLNWCGSQGGTTAGGSGTVYDADGNQVDVTGTDEFNTELCTSWDDDGNCTSGPLADGEYGVGDFSCPIGTVRAGSGGCANEETHQFELPTGYSCPTDTTFDGNSGGCQYDDGLITVPLDASGNPANGAASAAAVDFDGSGDAYKGTSDTATAGDGTAKFSTAGKNLSATTDLSQLSAILTEASKSLPTGYSVVVTSAERSGSGGSAHDSGSAVDIQIFGPDGRISNRGDISATGVYKDLAVAAYNAQQTLYPELGTKTLRWGGCFDTSAGSGVKDGMHYDLVGGSRPQGRYCSSGLSGLAAGEVSLAPKSVRVAAATVSAGSVRTTGRVLAAYTSYTNSSSGSSVKPGDPCTKSDGTAGRVQTPGSVLKDYLSNALKATGLDKLIAGAGDLSTQINGIMGDIGTVMRTVDMASNLFGGSSSGLLAFSGNSAYTSPFASYLSSSSYMGLTTQGVYTNAQASGVSSGTDLAANVSGYQAAWNTIGNAATAASTNLNQIITTCSTQASAAEAALATWVTPTLSSWALAKAVINSANALIAKAATDATSNTDDGAYANDLQLMATASPTATDVASIQAEADPLGTAVASPVGSLNIAGGVTVDRLNLINTNAVSIMGNAQLCPPPAPEDTSPTGTPETPFDPDGAGD